MTDVLSQISAVKKVYEKFQFGFSNSENKVFISHCHKNFRSILVFYKATVEHQKNI